VVHLDKYLQILKILDLRIFAIWVDTLSGLPNKRFVCFFSKNLFTNRILENILYWKINQSGKISFLKMAFEFLEFGLVSIKRKTH